MRSKPKQRRDRGDCMVDQRPLAKQRRCLVAAKPPRAAAGNDRPQNQADTSIFTGTDFAAGTWLSSA